MSPFIKKWKAGITLGCILGVVTIGGLWRYAAAQGEGTHPRTGLSGKIPAKENMSAPDLSITGAEGTLGVGIFNTSAAGQTASREIPADAKSPISYTFALRNDGDVTTKFKVVAKNIDTSGCTIKYYLLNSGARATEITSQILGGDGYSLEPLAPKTSSNFRVDIALVNPSTGSPPTISITAKSLTGEAKTDCIKAVTTQAPPGISIECKPSILLLPVGQSKTVEVLISAAKTVTGDVHLSVPSLPDGVGFSFNTDSVRVTNGVKASAKLTITASDTASTENHRVVLSGKMGKFRKETSLEVSVTDFSLSSSNTEISLQSGSFASEEIYLNAINGYSGNVTLATSVVNDTGSPVEGIELQPSPSKLSGSEKSISQIRVSVSDTVAPGLYKIIVSGSNAFDSLTRFTEIKLTVGIFTITADSPSIDIPSGQSKSINISSMGVNGPISNLILSASGTPVGMTVSASGNNTLAIVVSDSVPVGSYPLIITGKDISSKEATTSVTVRVTDFALSCTPSFIEANPGASGETRISVVPLGNFSDTLDLTAKCPEGVDASFVPAAISSKQSGILTVNLDDDLSPGTYHVIVTATDQAAGRKPVHQLKIKLVVNNFSVSVPSTSLKVPVGGNKTALATFRSPGSFAGPLQVGFGDVPKGVTPTAIPTSVQLTAGGMATCNITIAAEADTKPGSYKVPVTATDSSNHTASAILQVDVVDFSLNVEPEALALYAGESVQAYVTVNALGLFSDDVQLSLANVGGGIQSTLDLDTLNLSDVAILKVKALANVTPGDYVLTVTGTSGVLIRAAKIKVSVGAARHWSPGDPLQGGKVVSPLPNTVVAPGVSVSFALSPATDVDTWTTTDGKSGKDSDEVTYDWNCDGGSLTVSEKGTGGKWTAPRTPGTYTIECLINDVASKPQLPNTGSRDDRLPLKTTVTITVGDKSSHQVWTVGTPIVGGEIRAPHADQEIQKGATVQVAIDDAQDADHWQQVDEDDDLVDEGDDPDELVYSWNCSSGKFITGFDADGQPKLSSNSSFASPQWVAPLSIPASGTATLTVSIADKPNPVVKPDTGKRDDLQPTTHSVRLVIVNQVSQRVSKLQYAIGDLNDSTIWKDVPNQGEQGYPLTIIQGDAIHFHAIKSLPDQTWPDGMPVWAGEAEAGEYGETVTVYFADASQNDADLKKVTATCVNNQTAFVKVKKKYSLYITSKKDAVLAGGETEESQTTLEVSLSDYDGNVVPNASVDLASVYADAGFQPTENAAGILKGQGNEHPAGQLHRLRVRLNSKGKATIHLIAGVIPSFVGDTLVTGAVRDSISPVEVQPAPITFEPPTATSDFKDWIINETTGLFEAECTFTVDYRGVPLPGRNLSVRPTQILYADKKPVVGANPNAWAQFSPNEITTNENGQIQAKLIWKEQAAEPNDFDIEYSVDDNNILIPVDIR